MTMKVVLALALLVVAVTAEHCRDSRDCDSNNCATGTTATCTDRHVCTCDAAGSMTTMATTSCITRDDCVNAMTNCQHGGAHCVDGMCRCSIHCYAGMELKFPEY